MGKLVLYALSRVVLGTKLSSRVEQCSWGGGAGQDLLSQRDQKHFKGALNDVAEGIIYTLPASKSMRKMTYRFSSVQWFLKVSENPGENMWSEKPSNESLSTFSLQLFVQNSKKIQSHKWVWNHREHTAYKGQVVEQLIR